MNRLITLSCTIFLFSTLALFAQKDINSYKYVLIPEQYGFQKSKDQYQINSLTKFLFEKEGFNALSTGDVYPDNLAENSCSALKAVLKKNSSMFTTKIIIELTDCYNNVVFTSSEGTSKIKEYQKAYHEATRKAFESIKELDYKYDGSSEAIAKVLKVSEPKAKSEVIIEENVETNVNEAVKEVETVEADKVEVAEVAVVAAVVAPTEEKIELVEDIKMYSIEGNYFIDIWGKCTISKKEDGYKVVGGDENFEFATISKTSQPNLFMIKKVGFNQTKLVELDKDGNLKIDTNTGTKIYKRVD